MAAIDYWHPVYRSADLGRSPVGVKVAGGYEVVLFRTETGQVGALADACPHRRMRLSLGKVEGERVVCPYHGWSFDPTGAGCAPSSPHLRVCATRYDAAERYGAVWVKAAGSDATIPEIGGPGYVHVFTLKYHVRAPLELAVDNFAEIEHSVTTHILLAHDRDGIARTECKVDIEPDVVRITNVGPQKAAFEPFRWLLGYARSDSFVGEAKIRFDPVHLELKNHWLDAQTGEKRDTKMTGAVFFNPVSKTETELMLVGLVADGDSRLMRLAKKAFLTSVIHVETLLDKRMMENIADKNPGVEGMKLGRFDRPLYALRERINRIYWGEEPLRGALERPGLTPQDAS